MLVLIQLNLLAVHTHGTTRFEVVNKPHTPLPKAIFTSINSLCYSLSLAACLGLFIGCEALIDLTRPIFKATETIWRPADPATFS
jgi:hypothetical protein